MEKQIEKMAKVLEFVCELQDQDLCIAECDTCRATALYNAGYRKQSEVASEIFWEIDKLLTAIYLDDEDGTNFVGVDIQKYHALKKKYMEN